MRASTVGPVIVASKSDLASLNIAQNLLKHHSFSPVGPPDRTPAIYRSQDTALVMVEKEGIYVRPEDLPVKASSILFASKHRSSTNTPALTVHATGNLNRTALYGGSPEEISWVEPFRIREALSALSSEANNSNLQIEVTMEATHHGPTSFPVPVCFIEIGSGPEQWSDPVLGRIAANAVMASATQTRSQKANAVGFGGTHYSDKLTRICTEGDYQIGHIVPRHAFDAQISDRMIQETFHKTVDLCKTAVVDWKGLKGEQRRALLDQLSSWDIEVVRC